MLTDVRRLHPLETRSESTHIPDFGNEFVVLLSRLTTSSVQSPTEAKTIPQIKEFSSIAMSPNLDLLEQAASIQPATATSSTPSLHSSATTALVDKSGPFLRAPREVRDQIYRYLLFTKHTKHTCF